MPPCRQPVIRLLALVTIVVPSARAGAQSILPAGDPVVVPYTTGPRGHLVVAVEVNGTRRVPFVLDTGAGRTMLNQARLDSLGVVERASADSVQGAHGSAGMGVADVASLTLGALALGALELGTMDVSHVEGGDMPVFGILGYDVLSRFDLMIDFAQETVTLYPRATSVGTCVVCAGAMSVPFELAQGTHIRFEVTISDQPIAAVLDTGSGRSGMNYHAARAIGVNLPPPAPGAHGPALQVGAVELGGGVLARNLIVGVVDLPAFTALGVADGPAMLVGTGALAGRRVGISYGAGRLSIG